MSLSAVYRARVMTPMVIGLGLVALAARVPSTWAVLITAMVGAVGLLVPLPAPAAGPQVASPRAPFTWLASVALGLAALVIAAKLPAMLGIGFGAGGLVGNHPGPQAIGASVVAAVAEEAFFRRLVYGWLLSWGTVVAIAGSALAFAGVHVPAYGFAVLPIDAAAGCLLGWQRWMTGGWTASGVTHVAANLIAEGVFP